MKLSNIFAFAIMLMVASTTVSYAQSKEETKQATQTTTTVKTITPKVKGITCGSDLKTITANIKKLDGVTSCETGKVGATTAFTIVYDPTLVTEEQIHHAIQNTGGCKNPNDRPYKLKQ